MRTTLPRFMKYKYQCTSLDGIVQYLGCNLLPHGYWFFVSGKVPENKSINAVCQKLIDRYGIDISKTERSRRKAQGKANLQLVAFGQQFIILATKGKHEFFEAEGHNIKDARQTPIRLGDYSLTVKRGNFLKKEEWQEKAVPDFKTHARVQICKRKFRELKAYLASIACQRGTSELIKEICNSSFQPYAPIRKQILEIVRAINRRRQDAKLPKLQTSVICFSRKIVRPFGEYEK